MRYIGVDLHTAVLTACYMDAAGNIERVGNYPLDKFAEFLETLAADDELAVEACGNARWFIRQVEGCVGRVVLVNGREFAVIKKSVKKTDRRDAINPARFLRADLLPTVRLRERADRPSAINAGTANQVGGNALGVNSQSAFAFDGSRTQRKTRTPDEPERIEKRDRQIPMVVGRTTRVGDHHSATRAVATGHPATGKE